MVDLFPDEPPKPSILRVTKTVFQFPIAATEVYILDNNGQTLWQTKKEAAPSPLRWKGVDSEGKILATGDYVCRLVFPGGKNIEVPLKFES